MHVPNTDAAAPSGPPNVGAVQDAMPEVRSLPLKATATGWLYQPLKSAPRAGCPLVTTGAVLSTLIFRSMPAMASPSSTLQKALVPVVSVVKDRLLQPPRTVASEGLNVHSIRTSDRYQPPQFCGSGVHLNAMLGTASAAVGAASRSPATMARTARGRLMDFVSVGGVLGVKG
jgi:hypothetical protein